jgi:hypothetical protein
MRKCHVYQAAQFLSLLRLMFPGDFLSFSFQPPIAAAIFFIGLRSTSTVFAVTSVKLSEFA